MQTLAIDIGGTKIALGLVSNGQLVERRQLPTPTAKSAIQFAETILEQCQDWLALVENIGISTTGLVTEQGISAINPDTLAFPTPFPLHQAIEQCTGKTVAMLNDAQAAAWYEYAQLHAIKSAFEEPKTKNMAYITVSTGVGGGLVIDGKLHKGVNNFAGHIGHTIIDINGPICGCGQQGCVEAIASGTAIEKQSRIDISPAIDNKTLFATADTNPIAEAIIQRSCQAIAALCCNLKASLDLDVIVLGGGIGFATGYIDRLEQLMALRPAPFQVKIVPAQGDYDACLLGAAYQFIHID
ncbi:ROK family protein [Vibrio sinensis]|uniref:ROK family protein n=1 Tax=Vibrio sinensis TaxID=2302434 RepID=A0A3A6QRJ2_9VIBR|nr:N-acetylmannosamine kinase [Vibrio sinensis]RJX75365.1 ROK family protein [Vibrio sinensis]